MADKNRIRTNNRRTIRKSFPRFLSLAVMSFLGVFVFAGLTATAPDMITTLDQYLDDREVYDICVISDMGLMAEDVEAIGNLDGVEKATGGKSIDLVIEEGENSLVLQCNTVTDGINSPEVLEGRLPEAVDEIAVEAAFLEGTDDVLGDVITVESSSLKADKLTIVGVVKSPLYYNNIFTAGGRGNTSVGKGTIDYYAYICEDNLDFDYYTTLYVKVSGAQELVTSEEDYEALIEQVCDAIELKKTEREQARYDDIIENAEKQIQEEEDKAYRELNDTWAELEPKIQQMVDGKKQLEDAEQELTDNKDVLDDAKEQLASAKEELDSADSELKAAEEKLNLSAEELQTSKAKLDAAKVQLDETKVQLDSYKQQLNAALSKLTNAKAQLDSGKQELDENEKKLSAAKAELDAAQAQLEAGLAELNEGHSQYNQTLEAVGMTEEQIDMFADMLDENIDATYEDISTYQQAVEALDERIALCDDSADGQSQKAALQTQREEQALKYKRALDALETLNTQRDGLQQLQDAKQQLEAGDAEYNTNKASYDAALAEYNAGKAQFDTGMAQYEQGLREYEDGLTAYNQKKAQYDAAVQAYESGKAEYEAGKAAYEAGKAQYDAGKAEYDAGKAEYESGKAEYEAKQSEYEAGLAQWEAGEEEYESGKATYEENLNKYKNSATDYDVDIFDLDREFESMEDAEALYAEAKADIARQVEEARAELADVKMPTWYVYDRKGYSTYEEYLNDAESMENLAGLFPLIFYAVAVLVSLISMNRMVEEDRMEIGTLKSMGFDNRHIRSKYLNFSCKATVAGAVIGAGSGLVIIPKLIYNVYKLLFDLPDLSLTLQPLTTLLGFLIAVLCVCGTSVLTANTVVKEKPSELMRPKAPKNGKRIFLEKIPFIWTRLSFSQKITIRNMSRYKKRVLITVIGIMGCSALMLIGFGVRDSVADLTKMQYEVLYHFDGMAFVSQFVPEDFLNQSEVEKAYPIQQVTAESRGMDIFLLVGEDSRSIADFATLRDYQTGEELLLEDGKVIVTEKFATLTAIKVGDTLNVLDIDNNSYSLEVSGIVDNYINHYVYMTEATFEACGYTFSPNMVFFTTEELDTEEEEQLAEKLLTEENILKIILKESNIRSVQDMLRSLDSVILILLVLAAMLSFVVLYNLANININERKREIATLKVLGFYNKEVDNYITKETILVTIAGILIGLGAGTILTHIVVRSVEIKSCRFINQIQPASYLYTAFLTAFFTDLVNIITHFNLKRINMIDSLKSVE